MEHLFILLLRVQKPFGVFRGHGTRLPGLLLLLLLRIGRRLLVLTLLLLFLLLLLILRLGLLILALFLLRLILFILLVFLLLVLLILLILLLLLLLLLLLQQFFEFLQFDVIRVDFQAVFDIGEGVGNIVGYIEFGAAIEESGGVWICAFGPFSERCQAQKASGEEDSQFHQFAVIVW